MNLRKLSKNKSQKVLIEKQLANLTRQLYEIMPLYIKTYRGVAFPMIDLSWSQLENIFTIDATSGKYQLLSVIDYQDPDRFESIRSFCYEWNALTVKEQTKQVSVQEVQCC